jgi:hypothetical protein
MVCLAAQIPLLTSVTLTATVSRQPQSLSKNLPRKHHFADQPL